MARLNSYLTFDDNCKEAMNFYKDCLGGELTLITVGESQMASMMPASYKDSILHSSLTIGNNMLMGSDMRRKPLTDGDTVTLCLNCESEEELTKFYNKLSAGGSIKEPLGDMPDGAKIGVVTDKYKKDWMFYYNKNEAA
ncbi:MAG TPA: VOC family protein [Chitinophagaceae bacterium]|nr:VOC family protein [Chitinophagaceae bacterium]